MNSVETPKPPLDPDFFDIVGTEPHRPPPSDELPDDVRAIVEKIRQRASPIGTGWTEKPARSGWSRR
jgi:hypothetical protein